MVCGALLSGKENGESQKQEECGEKHHGRLAVSLRWGSNACWGFVSICADVIPILLVIKNQYHLLRTLTVSFRRHQIEMEAVLCRREGGGRRIQWGELTGNSWKLLMLCCPSSVGNWVWECVGYRYFQRKYNSHNITESMAKSLLGNGGIKGRLCCEPMTLDNGHYLRLAIPTATWEERRCPGLTGQGTLSLGYWMCIFTLSLSCVTADGGRVAGTQQHFGKERSETYG